jgi:hypothetical protein
MPEHGLEDVGGDVAIVVFLFIPEVLALLPTIAAID